MFKPNMIIKHKDFVDVACHVVEVRPETLMINWINLGQEKSWYINIGIQELRLDNPADWLVCLEPERHTCLRHARWEKL